MKDRRTSMDATDPVNLANRALDGDVPFDEALAGGGVEHVRSVRRVERLLNIEKNAVPDLTATVLEDVGARRGWLDARSRAMVWGGRGLIAATLLAAIAVTLGVRRAAPEFGPQAREAQALASVVDLGERAAAGATAPIATVVQTIETGSPVLVTITRRIDAPAPLASCELSFARGNREPTQQQAAGRVIVVNTELDPASQRTIDAIVRVSGSPSWVRAGVVGHGADKHD